MGKAQDVIMDKIAKGQEGTLGVKEFVDSLISDGTISQSDVKNYGSLTYESTEATITVDGSYDFSIKDDENGGITIDYAGKKEEMSKEQVAVQNATLALTMGWTEKRQLEEVSYNSGFFDCGNGEVLPSAPGVIGKLEYNTNESGYFFKVEGNTLVSNNLGYKTEAKSYIPIDLTATEADQSVTLKINAKVSSYSSDYGYIVVTDSESATSWYSSSKVNTTSGNVIATLVNKTGNTSNADYQTTLQGGKKYYIHFGYRKYYSSSAESSYKFTINSLSLYGTINNTKKIPEITVIKGENAPAEANMHYQVNTYDDNGWQTVDASGKITEVTINGEERAITKRYLTYSDTVYARLELNGAVSNYSSLTIIDSEPPTVNVKTSNILTDKITATASAYDAGIGMPDTQTYSFYIAKSNEEYPTIATHTGTENEYTFNGLTQGIDYKIKVETSDKSDNMGTGETTAKTAQVSSARENVTITPKWEGGTVTGVTITKGYSVSSNFKMQYQNNTYNDDGWTDVASGTFVEGATIGDTVYVCLIDDAGNIGSYASFTIVADKTSPSVYIYESGRTKNSISISVDADDSQSGMPDIPTYKYYLNGVLKATTSEEYYTFDGLNMDTQYSIKVETTDNSLNIGRNEQYIKTLGDGRLTVNLSIIKIDTGSVSISYTTNYNELYANCCSTNQTYVNYVVNLYLLENDKWVKANYECYDNKDGYSNDTIENGLYGLIQNKEYKVTILANADSYDNEAYGYIEETFITSKVNVMKGDIVISLTNEWKNDNTRKVEFTSNSSQDTNMYYYINTTKKGEEYNESNWNICMGNTAFIEGGATVYVTLGDYSGNYGNVYASMTIMEDNTPPEITLEVKKIRDYCVDFYFNYTDSESGIELGSSYEVYVAKINEEYELYNDYKWIEFYLNEFEIKNLEPQTEYKIKFVVRDKARNTSEKEIKITTTTQELLMNRGAIEIVWLDTNNNIIDEPEIPNISSEMTPIKWNNFEDEVETTARDSNWYKYSKGGSYSLNYDNDVITIKDDFTKNDSNLRWANVKLKDGSYFTWIPRYAYRIVYYTLDNEPYKDGMYCVTGYSDGRGICDKYGNVVYKIEDEIETVEKDGKSYIVHPAFEGNVNMGGWKNQLSGIWIAKYATSMEKNGMIVETPNTDTGDVLTNENIKAVSKPKIGEYKYWIDISIGNAYTNAFSYNRTLESHLIKNSEYATYAYLAYSQYGIFNADSKSYSTTGNITGVIDGLNTDSHEWVACWGKELIGGVVTNEDLIFGKSFASIEKISTEYATAYRCTTSKPDKDRIIEYYKTGDAIKETVGDGYTMMNGGGLLNGTTVNKFISRKMPTSKREYGVSDSNGSGKETSIVNGIKGITYRICLCK